MKKVNKYLVVLFMIFLVIILSVVMMRRNSIGFILKGFLQKKCSIKNNKIIY